MSLVLPPGGPIALIALGLLAMRWRLHAGRVLVIGGAAALYLCSLPILSNGLVTALGGDRPLDMAAAKSAEAIVILGGGVRSQAIEYGGGDTLGRLTLERVRYGAHLARQTSLPLLVTGGIPKRGLAAEADLMRDALESEYRLTVRWVERQSRNTRENAANTARLLLAEHRRRVVLVMHGFDVKRAKQVFENAGLEVIPAPIQVPRWGELEVADFLPSAAALYSTYFGLYEMLALARDAMEGWLSGRAWQAG